MDFYQAMMRRVSVRRYRREPLSKTLLDQIDDATSHVMPLIPENNFRVMRRDVVSNEDLIAAMGGYGRIISPPHYLVAYTIGTKHPLLDLAYRMEQIAIQMVQLGISNCFVGSLDRESNIRIRFRLNPKARIGAFLIFGYPAETVTGRTINAALRRGLKSANKIAADRIFYMDDFENSTAPPKRVAKLIEAARHAPSANNAQPWRFLQKDELLYLFVRRDNPRYGNRDVFKDYRLYDAGLCMANISMAMQVMDMDGDWEVLHGFEKGLPAHPELQAVARLKLSLF